MVADGDIVETRKHVRPRNPPTGTHSTAQRNPCTLGAPPSFQLLVGEHNLKSIYLIMSVVALGGCASVMNDTTHPMRIETKTESGEIVAGADCKLTNDKAAQSIKSGEFANVRRSSQDLEINCTHPSNPNTTAAAMATSRVNAGMFGNIIIGGGIGAIIDHSRGTAYTYPTWIQLIFGKLLSFNRADEQEGKPVEARGPNAPRREQVKENPRATNEQLQRW